MMAWVKSLDLWRGKSQLNLYICVSCGASGKKSTCQYRRCRRPEFPQWVRKVSWRRKQQPTPLFLAGKSHEQKSLASYSPWGCRKSDTTEHTNTHICIWDVCVYICIYVCVCVLIRVLQENRTSRICYLIYISRRLVWGIGSPLIMDLDKSHELIASWRPRMNNGPLESEGLRIRRTNGENSSPRLKVRKPEE